MSPEGWSDETKSPCNAATPISDALSILLSLLVNATTDFLSKSIIGERLSFEVDKLTSKKNDFEPLISLVSLIALAIILGLSKKKFSPRVIPFANEVPCRLKDDSLPFGDVADVERIDDVIPVSGN